MWSPPRPTYTVTGRPASFCRPRCQASRTQCNMSISWAPSKPHLLIGTDNNLGAETRIGYTSSTKILPPGPASRSSLVAIRWPYRSTSSSRLHPSTTSAAAASPSRYAYHHGYYDGVEREFRGFGAVDRWDVEELSAVVGQAAAESACQSRSDLITYCPPIRTSSWFHLGLAVGGTEMSTAYRKEYFHDPSAHILPQTVLPAEDLAASEEHDALPGAQGVASAQARCTLKMRLRDPHPKRLRAPPSPSRLPR